jgi:histone deacetylase 1/2
MMDNPEIQTFNHVGNKNGTGSINFENANGNTVAAIDMSRHSDGLWYTTNPVLMPPPHCTHEDTRTTTSIDQPSISKTATVHLPDLPSIDETLPTDDTQPTVKVTKSLEQLELWHQRMGHPAPRALQQTQRVVEGIPNLPNNNSIFSCPFCDKAKLRKSNRNKNSLREVFIPGTSFHMDLGFIRGPSNLEEVVKNGATPTKTIIKSRDGYEAYLLIVDAATRYIWVFLLKGKHPPIATIAQFLQKHGTATKGKITTTPGGLLDKSKSFATACTERGYECDTLDFDLNFEDSGLDTPRHTVRTDNGGELAGSTAFGQIIAEHGYIVEPTAPDASNQNGLAERPHKTLKERVRCLLYTAGLGIFFLADPLLHSVWLYNRTYHSRIEKTPFQAYTKRIPTLDGLITFG